MQAPDVRIRVVLAALFAVLPTCLCLYVATIGWWLLALGGDDDVTFAFDHALLRVNKVSGPGADPLAQIEWPLWLCGGWLLWTCLVFAALSWYERRSATQPPIPR